MGGGKECGHSEGPPQVFDHSLLTQEQVKLQTSNFVLTYLKVEAGSG